VPIGAAEVVRGTVTEWVRVPGTLGYAGAYAVRHRGEPGVVTFAAPAGTTVERGGVLYAVANQRIRLLYGDVPGYRGFAAGMTDGPDVRQLEENLVTLGLDPQHRIAVDEHFTAATGDAVRRWQAAWGVPADRRTSVLAEGQVLFLPGAVRIKAVEAAPGGAVEPDAPVLTATTTDRVVTVQLSVDRQRLVRKGDAVTVTVTGQPAFPGTVSDVGAVTAAPQTGSTGGQPPAGALVVPVTVAVTVPESARQLDQVPVQMAIAHEQHTDVLLVPVTALLARPGGGYRVRLDGGAFVEVTLGLFDEATGRVEVSGPLTPGQRVEVPAR
jgi:peptidoglycan hydrolase-like protein with peptidoglycan-binding domain